MNKSLGCILLVCGSLVAGWLFAGESTEKQADLNIQETKTVFMDVASMNRRKGAAKNLTKLYAKEAEQGWRVIDLELYIEDNDLEGFFVTFARNTTY